jgi:hypothetical protein
VRPVLFFSTLTLVLSWTYWLAVIASQHGWLAVSVPLTPFGAFGPAIAASIIYTGVYLRSRPSLLPALALHTFQDVSLGLAPVLWPAAGRSAVFWYAYFGVVLVVGLGVAGWLASRSANSSPAAA